MLFIEGVSFKSSTSPSANTSPADCRIIDKASGACVEVYPQTNSREACKIYEKITSIIFCFMSFGLGIISSSMAILNRSSRLILAPGYILPRLFSILASSKAFKIEPIRFPPMLTARAI